MPDSLFFGDIGGGAVYLVDADGEPFALVETGFGHFETSGHHTVHGLMRRDTIVHDQGVIVFLAEQGHTRQEAVCIGPGNRGSFGWFAGSVFEDDGDLADHERIVGGVGHAEIDDGDRAVLIDGRGPHLEKTAGHFDVSAALHIQDGPYNNRHHGHANGEADGKPLFDSSHNRIVIDGYGVD